ncbi:MAG TPA: DUF308 domain-containing protein [Candidatus Saccharimonadales bacterium]|nr:DUF308 domain-containing protein [Candidatus Saccharimonadales bacterium]
MSTTAVTKDLWGAWLMRGFITLVFGIAAVFWPGLTLLVLIYLFGAFVLVSGVVTVLDGVLDIESGKSWFLSALLGVFELGVGVYLLRHPTVSFKALIVLIGFVILARGLIELVRAFLDNEKASRMALMVFGGLLGVAVGIIMFFQKVSGGVDFVWLLGGYAMIVGTLQVARAVQARHSLDS